MVKGWVPISVAEELEKRLIKIYESDTSRPSNLKFSPWVGEVLTEIAQLREDFKKFGPWFSYRHNRGTNVIELVDHTNSEYITILLDSKDRKIICQKHGRPDCIHTGFCYGYPATYKLLVDKGIVPDRTKTLDLNVTYGRGDAGELKSKTDTADAR
jgi:hypothetical protein